MNPFPEVPEEELQHIMEREEDYISGYLAGLEVIRGDE